MPDDDAAIPNARPRRILVIGGGPSGLVTLRNLLGRGDFDDVQLVERRDDVGGVWNFNENDRWPSPAYEGLIGNVLPEFLSFSAHPPFPEPPSTKDGQPFPSLTETQEYLRAFAAPLLAAGRIRLGLEVLRVEELPQREGWRVLLRDRDGKEAEEQWDAVVVAVAFYDNEAYPDTPGVDALRVNGLTAHCRTWRGPQGYDGKRVLVVGNANSGNDIAAQLAPVAGAVYQSIRRPNFPGFPSLPDERIVRVKPVVEYTVGDDQKTARPRLADGSILDGLDCVMFATGYYPHPSFVHIRAADTLTPLVGPTHRHIPALHRYTLYAYNPSLAFVGTAVASYTPFTIADICSTWLALAWSTTAPVSYPTSLKELLAFEQQRFATVAQISAELEAQEGTVASALLSYCLGPYEETFASDLRRDAVAARPELDAVLPVWNAERTEAREAMFAVKREALERARDAAAA
ncbi:hypothetical protein HMN09_00930400 [Mycena chlorophos]|uniref:FAD/NAD(P)-binding domain-containing protein n=1 Tax=Mycena chlorophos TaxID=658473 RepID=A0A8H6VZZ4_MYCCL|nr:hypothetical protein HMN09_00930400 [Mycena chlorophos]